MSTLESICGSEGHSVTSACVVSVFGLCVCVCVCVCVRVCIHVCIYMHTCVHVCVER